ncbi:MAG: endopeptidase La [Negativibacillus sp.]|nr:endopeptidase La [Negativibacillus sp.]
MTQEQIQMTEVQTLRLPTIAIRGLVMFPNMVLHFDVARQKSILALNRAMQGNQKIFLVTQKNSRVENPTKEDLYTVGVVAKVKQILKAQSESVRVVVEGQYRARMCELVSTEPFYEAMCEEMPMLPVKEGKHLTVDAYLRVVKDLFEEYCFYAPKMPKDLVVNIIGAEDPVFVSEYLSQNLGFSLEDKQMILEESSIRKRLEMLSTLLRRENDILAIEHSIAERVKDQMDRNQKEYYLREQIKAIRAELGEDEDGDTEIEKYRTRLREIEPDEETEKKLTEEINKLSKMVFNSQEAMVSRNYLDTVFSLPWNKLTEDKLDIAAAREKLDADHYGLQKVKERILEILAVRKLEPNIKGQIICLVGPPGVGKTSIARSIAEAMGRKYVRMSLGGVRDEADIRGHRKTYIGAMPGRVVSALKQADSMNPLMLLDEIDKLGSDFKGDPSSALLEVLDSEQNFAFRDHYLEIPLDLSNVLFFATANDASTIPAPLYDRMEIINLSSYTREEKFQIAKRHLVPKQVKRHGLNGRTCRFYDDALYSLIDHYVREAGVRTLEREIATLCRKSAKMIVEGEKKSCHISAKMLESLLGPQKYKDDDIQKEDLVGVVNGLAWTAVGGEILQAEVAVVDGTGKLELTGSLGDVMKESAKAAITCVRSLCDRYGIDKDFYKTKDIHIHFPEGAVPKDGPSAGVTITTALVSALSGIPVRHDVAMTGEITLRGRVLPIGGLKEKTMAAYRNGMKTVVIPQANEPDLYEVDPVVKENITFVTAKEIGTVLEKALVPMLPLCPKDSNPPVKKNARTMPEPPVTDCSRINA